MADNFEYHIDSNKNSNEPKKTAVKRASKLVDSVNDLLEGQLSKGMFKIQENQKPLKIKVQLKETVEQIQERQRKMSKIKGNKRSISVLNSTLDIDEHKKMVKKFIKMNRKSRKNQQIRSVQIQEKSRKQLLNLEKWKQQQKNKTLQTRRSEIQRRMSEKQLMLKEIQKQFFQQKQRVKSLRTKKFLYQQKQQQFRKKYILPKLQQEQMVLANKRKLLKPIDMSQIISHERKYTEELINNSINRQMNSRMIAQQWNYQPPEYVPKSYIISEEERQLKKAEDQFKAKQVMYNQIKKKQFLQALDQIRQIQRDKSSSPQKNELKQTKSPRIQLSRQAKKSIGNQYMKQFFKTIDRSKIKHKKIWPGMVEQEQKRAKLAANKKIHTQYQLELIKQERIQKVQKIRFKKIAEISNDKNASDFQKYTKLIQQAKRLDKQVSQHKIKTNNHLDREQIAAVIISSIHAKLATLQIQSKQQNYQLE